MSLDYFLDRLVNFFTSLRLTVVCLALALVLVFWGTIAQVDLGLYKAQNEYFRSFLIYWGPKGASWRIPVFPGGYFIGGVLLINLIASQLRRFSFAASKIGLWMVHVGLILLLLGQLLTDLLSRESTLHLREGEARNYSEVEREAELAVIDTTDPDADKVVAISKGSWRPRRSIGPGDLPFTVRVKQFFANSQVADRPADAAAASGRYARHRPPCDRQRIASRHRHGPPRRPQCSGGAGDAARLARHLAGV